MIYTSEAIRISSRSYDTMVSSANDITILPANISIRRYLGRPSITQTSSENYIAAVAFNKSDHTEISLKINNLNDPVYRLLLPIGVKIDITEDEAVASVPGIDVSISGSTCSEALHSLREFLEHLHDMASSNVPLGMGMSETAEFLRKHIVK